jgi:hypothetical protein
LARGAAAADAGMHVRYIVGIAALSDADDPAIADAHVGPEDASDRIGDRRVPDDEVENVVEDVNQPSITSPSRKFLPAQVSNWWG